MPLAEEPFRTVDGPTDLLARSPRRCACMWGGRHSRGCSPDLALCGRDVPADAAYLSLEEEITCAKCRSALSSH